MTRLESDETVKRNFYFSFFLEDISPFIGSLVSLLWISGDICLGFQRSCASSFACNGFPWFTPDATPTELLLLLFMASIAAEPFWSTYFFKHWYTDTQDWVCGTVYALTIWTTPVRLWKRNFRRCWILRFRFNLLPVSKGSCVYLSFAI